ncbi:MAG: enoyl-CoA hydratase/isomerase family protein [Bacteroidia bacterium]|jgi:enoyl-CoA hydratase|nr:enoyl-CoA hydratase/isomerase family protein [Bacteroidia bacterium]MCC6767811.1 enoyl-CoA hydratase/isomerase family protein [Bacteroidia bacterium]
MQYQNILTSSTEQIFTITINRPDKLNALNYQTIQEIGQAVMQAETDANIRGIIITGTGEKAFAAGADISEFANFNAAEAEKLSREGGKVFTAIEQCTKPVIAAVNGFALGGGCELAMACHLRIASANARFGQPEVNLGLIPGYAGTQRLTQLIGKGKALEYLMTADMIAAEEALRLGLVNAVVERETLLSTTEATLKKIATKAPLAIAAIIRSVNSFYAFDQDGFETEIREFSRCFETDDFKEGTTAFLGKRAAVFQGR